MYLFILELFVFIKVLLGFEENFQQIWPTLLF